MRDPRDEFVLRGLAGCIRPARSRATDSSCEVSRDSFVALPSRPARFARWIRPARPHGMNSSCEVSRDPFVLRDLSWLIRSSTKPSCETRVMHSSCEVSRAAFVLRGLARLIRPARSHVTHWQPYQVAPGNDSIRLHEHQVPIGSGKFH